MPLKQKRVTIDGNSVVSLESFYDEITRQLHFPKHFGRNLDALWDILSADIPGPFEIIWENHPTSSEAMGDDFIRLQALLEDVANDREDFRFVLR